jgi:hypothetical protein
MWRQHSGNDAVALDRWHHATSNADCKNQLVDDRSVWNIDDSLKIVLAWAALRAKVRRVVSMRGTQPAPVAA